MRKAMQEINIRGKMLWLSLLSVLLFSVTVFATYNPSVSHSSNAVTNGDVFGNYSNLEVGV